MNDLLLEVQQGSLYPALRRLEQRGWIKSNMVATATGPTQCFYMRQVSFYGKAASFALLSTSFSTIDSLLGRRGEST